MRVALVHMRHSGTGGTERYLTQVARHLALQGHDVTIVCRSHEEPPHPAVRFVVLRPLAIGAAWRLWGFARAVERHVAAGGYDVVFGLGRTWSQDVVRLGGGCHQTYLDVAMPAVRDARRLRLRDRLILALEAWALRPGAYAQVIVNSEMVKRDVMQRHAVPAKALTVIHNGVDLIRFDAARYRDAAAALRTACGFGAGDHVVLFLGSGYARKGLDTLLDAFSRLAAQRADIRLLVVGYDAKQGDFERRAAALRLDGQVRFLGGRRDTEVCYAAADVYALPTYYDPFANSTLEALASGLPVITTSRNGASALLAHREHGSVIAAGDSEALAAELCFWTAGGRSGGARAAARTLAQRHSEEATMRASAQLLERVAAKKVRRDL